MRTDLQPGSEPGTSQLSLAVVANARAPGLADVRLGDGLDLLECHIVEPAEGRPLQLRAGDRVIVWRPVSGEPGIVIGRLAAPASKAPPTPKAGDAPDELILEAKQSLVLRVGSGSITMRGDGKILIKGKDLVSHAERMNRVKGGAVAIN